MSLALTSGLTQILSIAIATLTFLGVLLFWGKLYRKGFTNLFLRALILLIVISLTLTSIGLTINKSQGFFSSWSDLFGGSENYSTEALLPSSVKVLDASFLKNAQPIGKDLYLLKEVITGKKSFVSNVVYLVLPTHAVKELKAGRSLDPTQYQVVEFLTGFPSQPEMWFKALKIEDVITAYNSSHTKNIIGVIPQINIAGKTDLECMNFSNGQPDAETWLTADMHTYANRRLGLPESRWVAVGVSTGAWCAAMFSLKHPDLYRGALAIAGYYRPALPLSDSIELQKAMIAKYGVARMEKKLTSIVPLYIVASLGDIYSIRETKRFLAKPHPRLNIFYHEIPSGGHNPRVWKASILPGLKWLI